MLLILKKVLNIRKVNVNVVKVKRIVRIKKLMIQSFIEAVGGGDELKDSVGVYYVLLFLYRFGFFLVSDTLLCVFVLMVIRNCLRMLVLIPISKMMLMVMNCCRFLIWCALFLFRV